MVAWKVTLRVDFGYKSVRYSDELSAMYQGLSEGGFNGSRVDTPMD